MCKTIINHILAGYPLLYLETVEPTRAIVELSEKLTAKKINPVIWDIDRGIQGMENSEENPVFPIEFLANESKKGKENVLFALNFHCFWDNIQVKQKLLNSLPSFKASGQTFVIVSPAVKDPDGTVMVIVVAVGLERTTAVDPLVDPVIVFPATR